MANEQAIMGSLRLAGITVVKFRWTTSRVPADAAWMISACTPEDGRIDQSFDQDDPRLIEKANVAWWQLASEHRLLDDRREFLLSVGPLDGEAPAKPHWARVRLEKEWNIIAKGTDHGVLGGPPGRPGFVMLSVDEYVAVGGTTWSDSISIIVVPNPANASAIRKFVGMQSG